MFPSEKPPELPDDSRIAIRPGTVSDIELMALIAERASAARTEEDVPDVLPPDSEDLSDLLERSNREGFWSHLAFDDGEVIGFAAGYPGAWKENEHEDLDSSHTDYLWLLMIEPEHWGRGVAKKLLTEVADTSRSRGLKQLELYTQVGNDRARGLYESAGYQQAGPVVISDTQGELVKYRLEL